MSVKPTKNSSGFDTILNRSRDLNVLKAFLPFFEEQDNE